MTAVTLLGTKGGPAVRAGGAMPTSSLIEIAGRQIVVDCGLGVTQALVNAGVALKDLSTIFITHLHSDHYLELGPLLHTAWTAGLRTPVQIIGPAGLAHWWQHFQASMAFDIDLRIADEGRPDFSTLVQLHPLQEGVALEEDGLTVRALRNLHPPIEETYALRFDHDGRSVVFSGDTAYFPPLAKFARGADLLVHEAMLPEAVDYIMGATGNVDNRLRVHLERSHTLPAEAGRIATEAGVKALAFHHLIPTDNPDVKAARWEEAVREAWGGPFHLGHDGMRIDV